MTAWSLISLYWGAFHKYFSYYIEVLKVAEKRQLVKCHHISLKQ